MSACGYVYQFFDRTQLRRAAGATPRGHSSSGFRGHTLCLHWASYLFHPARAGIAGGYSGQRIHHSRPGESYFKGLRLNRAGLSLSLFSLLILLWWKLADAMLRAEFLLGAGDSVMESLGKILASSIVAVAT